jgi:flagellar biosynthesis protein FlhB
MAGDSAQDKNLPASEQRLKQAREDGQVARSRDLSHFGVIAVGLGAVMLLAPSATHWLQRLLATGLTFDVNSVVNPLVMKERLALLFLPAMAGAMVLALLIGTVASLAAVASGGWVWTFKPLMPDLNKLNPLTGLARIVSKAQLGDMLKACVLALILGVVGASYLWMHVSDFVMTQALPLPAALGQAGERILTGLWLLVLVLAAFAAVDVPLQRFLHKSRLKMSLQEMKEEFKQQEGNQEVKGKMKQRMREAANRRMMAAVPEADLVVMNPTHYAVALKYDETAGGAPKVVAKGADLLALKIRDIARDARVPVLQAPPLARALYAHAEVDREIPFALYTAVAQVLAHVFQLRAALAGRGPWPADLQPIGIPPELDPHHRPAAAPA